VRYWEDSAAQEIVMLVPLCKASPLGDTTVSVFTAQGDRVKLAILSQQLTVSALPT